MISAIISKELVTYHTHGTPSEIKYRIESGESMLCWRYTDYGKKLTGDTMFMDTNSILAIREEAEASPLDERTVEGL